MLAQIFAQDSDDPFLMLVTLSHESFDEPIRLVNNTEEIISRGETFTPFPMRARFPVDDGESARDFTMEFDNVSLDLIAAMRTVTSQIGVKIELILASMPNEVQMIQDDLLIGAINYNQSTIQVKIILDSFLNTELTSETYGPTNFPGLF